jgi:hypothetical protein
MYFDKLSNSTPQQNKQNYDQIIPVQYPGFCVIFSLIIISVVGIGHK